jgi:hypothetical protein
VIARELEVIIYMGCMAIIKAQPLGYPHEPSERLSPRNSSRFFSSQAVRSKSCQIDRWDSLFERQEKFETAQNPIPHFQGISRFSLVFRTSSGSS